MKFNVTAGKWSVNKDPNYYNGNKAYEVNYGIDGECVAEVVHVLEDAKLISLAPEMLNMMHKIVSFYKQNGNLLSFDIKQVNDLIAEATTV